MGYLTRTARHLGARGMFEPTGFVCSRGLALLCEHHGGRACVREWLVHLASAAHIIDSAAHTFSQSASRTTLECVLSDGLFAPWAAVDVVR